MNQDPYYRSYRNIITVYLSCNGTFVPESKVEFVDICEGLEGEDILTFICPECGEEHQSKRFG